MRRGTSRGERRVIKLNADQHPARPKKMKILVNIILPMLIHFNTYAQVIDCSKDRVKMERCVFDSIVNKNVELMAKNVSYTIGEMICLVKANNTLLLITNYCEKEKYMKFIRLFNNNYLKKAFFLLGCTYGDGLSIYSKKYDLNFGPSLFISEKDHFILIE